MKYLHQITDSQERKYIETRVSSIEKTSLGLKLLFIFCLIIPYMLLSISINQFAKVLHGYASVTDVLIALPLFIFGMFFAYGFYFLGIRKPMADKKFVNRVNQGQICLHKIQIEKTLKTSNSNGTANIYYVTSYYDEDGSLQTNKLIRAYNYTPDYYQNGIFYCDTVHPNKYKGIIPLYGAKNN